MMYIFHIHVYIFVDLITPIIINLTHNEHLLQIEHRESLLKV